MLLVLVLMLILRVSRMRRGVVRFRWFGCGVMRLCMCMGEVDVNMGGEWGRMGDGRE